ncbi:hypothetical protein WKH56_08985 [Priestia sp. SB1]|uniref:Uncharacterized protein n=1 Tax=Priestia aryabhattai TaxID=412384 RepID=A0AAX6NDI9_PRIAR|nr:hypothetical protein [Priestia aryabhattai]MDU9693922.1 hypothetical protein [Priestia aryabhattai]
MNSLNKVSKEEYLDFELIFHGSVRNVVSLFSKREGFNPDYITEELVETISRNVIKAVSTVTNNQVNLNGYKSSEVKKSVNSLHTRYLAEMLNEKAEKVFSSVSESGLKLSVIDRIISFVIYAQAGVLKPNLEGISNSYNNFYLLENNVLSTSTPTNFFDTTLYYLVCTFVARQGLNLSLITKELIDDVGTRIIEGVFDCSKGKINLSQVRSTIKSNNSLNQIESLHLKCLEQIVRKEMNSYLFFRSNSYKNFSLIDRIIHLVNSLIFRTLEDPMEIIQDYGLDFFEEVTTSDVAAFMNINA